MTSRPSLVDSSHPAKRPRARANLCSDDNDDAPIVVPGEVTARIRRALLQPPPRIDAAGNCFSLLSWNIDGIDDTSPQDMVHRALHVAEHIAQVQPAAVFLQEAIPPQLELFAAPQVLGEYYDFISPENPRLPYYCVIMLHKKQARLASVPRTTHFHRSKMGRHFLAVDVVIHDVQNAPVTLVTSHLESTKPEKDERQRQLAEVMRAVLASASKESPRTVIFGGDLNTRDQEVAAVRSDLRNEGLPVDNICDAWVWCGSNSRWEHTWDTSQNTNLGVLYSSKCRFDRVLFAATGVTDGRVNACRGKVTRPLPPPAGTAVWFPSVFELCGKSKVASIGRFASDHWGVQMVWSCLQGSSCQAGAKTVLSPDVEDLKVRESNEVSGKNEPGSIAVGADEDPSSAGEVSMQERRLLALAAAERRMAVAEGRGIGDHAKVKTITERGQHTTSETFGQSKDERTQVHEVTHSESVTEASTKTAGVCITACVQSTPSLNATTFVQESVLAWTCSQCTFLNNACLPSCEMCDALRPPPVLPSNGEENTSADNVVGRRLFADLRARESDGLQAQSRPVIDLDE